MEETIKLLEEEINSNLKELKKLDKGSEDYCAITNDTGKLLDKLTPMIKLKQDAENAKENREHDKKIKEEIRKEEREERKVIREEDRREREEIRKEELEEKRKNREEDDSDCCFYSWYRPSDHKFHYFCRTDQRFVQSLGRRIERRFCSRHGKVGGRRGYFSREERCY